MQETQKRFKTRLERAREILDRNGVVGDERDALEYSIRSFDQSLSTSGGATFVSTNEANLLTEVLAGSPYPTLSIDLHTERKPFEIAQAFERRNLKRHAQAVITGFDQERMEEIDPHWQFDGLLRHHSQSSEDSWAVFLQGTGHFGNSGSISGASMTSHLASVEKRKQRSDR